MVSLPMPAMTEFVAGAQVERVTHSVNQFANVKESEKSVAFHEG